MKKRFATCKPKSNLWKFLLCCLLAEGCACETSLRPSIHLAAIHLQTTVREKEKQKSQYFMFKWFYARFSIHDMTKPYYPPVNQQSFYLCCMFCLLLSPPCVVPEENLIRFMVFSYSTTNCNENIINKIFPFTADLYWFIINRFWWLFWAVSRRKLKAAEVWPDNLFLVSKLLNFRQFFATHCFIRALCKIMYRNLCTLFDSLK